MEALLSCFLKKAAAVKLCSQWDVNFRLSSGALLVMLWNVFWERCKMENRLMSPGLSHRPAPVSQVWLQVGLVQLVWRPVFLWSLGHSCLPAASQPSGRDQTTQRTQMTDTPEHANTLHCLQIVKKRIELLSFQIQMWWNVCRQQVPLVTLKLTGIH